MTVLSVRGLSVGYYRGLDVLHDVTIGARSGTITAILGANGAGKSTLLRAIAGFLVPSTGLVTLDGVPLTGVPPHDMIRRGVAYIPQARGVFEHMNVAENLLIGAWHFRWNHRMVQTELQRVYDRFPILYDRRHGRAGLLSGGQQRMIEIGRSLMADARVVLVDEPTASLARTLWGDVYQMLSDLRAEGRTVLLVDQEIQEALKIADYVYLLDGGTNRSEGTPSAYSDLEASFWT